MNLKGIMQTMGVQPGQVVSDPYSRAFAPQPQVETIVKEEEDHEVSMAQNQLDSIIKAATELKSKIGEGEKDIPAWIQDHITNSENYINQAASNYHEYNEGIVNEDDKWIQKAVDPKKKGQLHRDLGVPEDETIPLAKLQAATQRGGDVAKRAQFALNVRKEGKTTRLSDIVNTIIETPVIGSMVGSRTQNGDK